MLEWRKSQDDLAPNGYVDLTSVKMIALAEDSDAGASASTTPTGTATPAAAAAASGAADAPEDGAAAEDGGEGLTIDGKRHCFVIVDERGAEHSFCAERWTAAETHRTWLRWYAALASYGASARCAPPDGEEAPGATGGDAGEPGPGSPAPRSPAKAGAPAGARAPAAGAEGEAGAADGAQQQQPLADRLIVRVCVGSIRRPSPGVFGAGGGRRVYFELKTGSFSRTTRTVAVSGGADAPQACWNETFSLASSVRECAPLVLTAFEERSRALPSLSARAPPRLLGSTVVSWSHYAHEECVCFWALLRAAQADAAAAPCPLGEVKLTLQVLAPDSGAGQPQPAAARPAAQAGGPGGLGPKPPGAPAAFHHNNQRRRASEISMVDINAVASRGVGAYGGGAAAASPQRGTRAHPGGGEDEEADEDGGGGFCYGSDDRGAEGFMGSVRSIFSQCFGAGGAGGAHPGDRYQRV